MLIDCDSCAVRDIACAGCVVPTLLNGTGSGVDIDEGEWRALELLAAAGLIPPLRHTAYPESYPGDYPEKDGDKRVS
jgi:hypothetical protein